MQTGPAVVFLATHEYGFIWNMAGNFHNLCELACGPRANRGSDLAITLDHISATLKALLDELDKAVSTAPSGATLLVPLAVRGTLELAFTALIGRMDPFRLLTLRAIQNSSTYDPGKRVSAAIQWQGDVMSEKAEKAPAWDVSMKTEKISRAMLSDHQDEVFWQPSFLRFLDATNKDKARGSWSDQLLALQPEAFIPSMRSVAAKTYSTSSKHIHFEHLLPRESYSDEASLRDLVDSGLRVAASLSLVANFSEHLAFGLPTQRALELFEALQ